MATKFTSIVGTTARIIAAVLLALVLLLAGVVGLLYSSWAQDIARRTLVSRQSGSTRIALDSFSLRFPLHATVGGLCMSVGGDTIASARGADIDIRLLPLLAGRVVADKVAVTDLKYVLGTPDSAMYMTIAADSISLTAATVRLLPHLGINLDGGSIRGGRLTMVMTPDTAVTPPTPPQHLDIGVGDIALDDFTFAMRMMPAIDTLNVHIRNSVLSSGSIDMYRQTIRLRRFGGSGMDARYIVPDSSAIAACGPYPPVSETADSLSPLPWTVQIDTISFDRSRALYTTAGTAPLPGFDPAYIAVDNLSLGISNFYNRATTVRLPISLTGTERCGLTPEIRGTLDIDSVSMRFGDVTLGTAAGTAVSFSGMMGMGDLATDTSLPLEVNLDGSFAPVDLSLMFPLAKPMLAAIPSADDIRLLAKANGTTGRLDIENFDLTLNRCAAIKLHGTVENMMLPDLIAGHLDIGGNISNSRPLRSALLPPNSGIAIPPLTFGGSVSMRAGVVDGNMTARTGHGKLALNARWNGRAEDYHVTVAANAFPIQAFLPLSGVSDLTAAASVDGRGYNLYSPVARLSADAHVNHLVYQGTVLDGINAKAELAQGQLTADVSADNKYADLRLHATGELSAAVSTVHATADLRHLDLYALGFATEPASLEASLAADATMGPGRQDVQAAVILDDLFFRSNEGTVGISDVNLQCCLTDSLCTVTLQNRDLRGTARAQAGLDRLMAVAGSLTGIIDSQIRNLNIDVGTIAGILPPFAVNVHGGTSNMVNDILATSKMSVRSFSISAAKDSVMSLNGTIMALNTGSMLIDSTYVNARQHHEHLHFDAGILNRPGNLDQWHSVAIHGRLDGNKAALRVQQQNIAGATGFDLGFAASANAADSSVTLHIRPTDPIVGYQQWQANDSNYITYTIPTRHIDADLHMKGGNSSLSVFSDIAEGHDSHGTHQEDLVIQLGDIHLQDWIAVNPFAPPVSGDINADMRLNTGHGTLTGKGSAGITNFLYGKEKVADFKADFDIAAMTDGSIRADADLFVDGRRTITVSGTLNDSTATSPLALDLSMIHFPLSAANPFIPPAMGRLQGMLNGSLKVSGTTAGPVMNGTLDFDSTSVFLALTGTQYAFSDTPIDVTDNIVRFNKFAISGCNENPLTIDGQADISDLADVKLNLALKADNMMLVNSNRALRGADIFGKAYMSLDATARGSMKFMAVNAKAGILPGTNVTYIVPEAESAITSRANSDMVRFVNFADSAAVAAADTIAQSSMALLLNATLGIAPGSIFNVYLSSNGQNRLQLQPSGTLTYAMSPVDEGRLTGRLVIDKGFVRYTPPLMSEKLFDFDPNSFVAFTGNMLNPTLGIHAVDKIKANVTQAGQNTRTVTFDVKLAVTGTLENMNVAFDLATDDDITIANELETMSADQRANQAMNMLLYNVYTGPGSRGDALTAGNPLFTFLESQVNSWAANNIKGVDLTFGIDQYDRTVGGSTSTTTSYSYQVSKSLFNDRFKIVIGGNYSTDADADENFSQNLINDISFDYFLNNTHTMYVRLFRHTGYESILEGEITRTGVGFVYRRKLSRLADMFIPVAVVRRRQERSNATSDGNGDNERTTDNKQSTAQ